MSGICGILRLDGKEASVPDGMATILARRGPDCTRDWRDGCIAFGHTLLATTPESLHEALPLLDPETGCAITADARIDNREELMGALRLFDQQRMVGDGEIILKSFLAWGDACVERILGDFAFAIWDPRRRRVFAARDHLGMRQLTYSYLPGRLFAFGTEPRAVLEVPEVPRDLNEGRIADHLVDPLEAIDFEETFYQAVRRLPPAHHLSADSSGITVRRYWSLTPGPPLRLASDEAYSAAFLEVFTEAVRCRLRSAGPVGSMLSGGLDSGSVATVAARLLAQQGRGPLPTFSVIGPDPDNYAETLAIQASIKMPGLDPHLVDVGNLSGWADDLRAALTRIDEPFDGHMNLVRAIYLAASRAGVRVILDGAAGDVVLHQGNYLPALARTGRLVELWREVVAQEQHWNGDSWRWRCRTFLGSLRAAFVPDALRRLRRLLQAKRDTPELGKLISPAFAAEVDVGERMRRWQQNTYPVQPTSPYWRAALISGPMMLVGRERYDRVAAAFAVEPRDPFLDKRVIEFCLSCPTGQMRRQGWTKFIMRVAMQGLLPTEVIWRRGRTHLGHSLTQELLGGGRYSPPRTDLMTVAHRQLFHRATNLPDGQRDPMGLSDVDEWELWYLALWLTQEGRLGPETS